MLHEQSVSFLVVTEAASGRCELNLKKQQTATNQRCQLGNFVATSGNVPDPLATDCQKQLAMNPVYFFFWHQHILVTKWCESASLVYGFKKQRALPTLKAL